MTNYKRFKIITKESLGSYVKYGLDNHVTYKERKENHIFMFDRFPFNNCQIEDYLEIDIDRTINFSSWHGFSDLPSVEGIVKSEKMSASTNIITSSGSSSDIVISPSVVSAMGSSQATELARYMSRMVDETDKEFELKIEDNSNARFTYSLICRKQK